MYQCCIFDLDGTLANTLPSIAYFGNAALKKYGFHPIETDRYRYLVGTGAHDLVKFMLAEHGCHDEQIFQKVYECYNQTYENNFLYLTEPYAGIPELLQELQKREFRLGILSNKPQSTAQKVAEGLFGKNCFQICYGKREGFPLKPNPSVLLAMLDAWGISKENCLYIGDTSVDMQTAQNANVTSVGVLWGFRDRTELEENNAAHIVSAPQEIITVIDTSKSAK